MVRNIPVLLCHPDPAGTGVTHYGVINVMIADWTLQIAQPRSAPARGLSFDLARNQAVQPAG
jgi:hypothetical protein